MLDDKDQFWLGAFFGALFTIAGVMALLALIAGW